MRAWVSHRIGSVNLYDFMFPDHMSTGNPKSLRSAEIFGDMSVSIVSPRPDTTNLKVMNTSAASTSVKIALLAPSRRSPVRLGDGDTGVGLARHERVRDSLHRRRDLGEPAVESERAHRRGPVPMMILLSCASASPSVATL